MYRELISELSEWNEYVKIQPPCPENEIDYAEQVVGYTFPKELKDLLRELNGDNWLFLSAKEIVENVERSREFFIPFFEKNFSYEEYIERVDRFIFFATNGCGDYYCYSVSENGIPNENAIYIWEHEEMGEKCCWRLVATNMVEFITRYYKDEI